MPEQGRPAAAVRQLVLTKYIVVHCNSHPLAVDDQGYVMLFTRLIASKAMTDAAGPPRISTLSLLGAKAVEGVLAIMNDVRTTSQPATASARTVA
jgi:hypothetical protein